ncbi:hypothetical protein LTR36_003800 [Oleoguttula mirabilis]|uniref:C2H2-type domain-containing protein n=1 Tax=Oleoguttula mirabilis TaxID=1507867 RepID=A0AAV9JIX3_9PEZI|nr:hypothetical protein LTR36_003800 [Oleoguttula mirabilis]
MFGGSITNQTQTTRRTSAAAFIPDSSIHAPPAGLRRTANCLCKSDAALCYLSDTITDVMMSDSERKDVSSGPYETDDDENAELQQLIEKDIAHQSRSSSNASLQADDTSGPDGHGPTRRRRRQMLDQSGRVTGDVRSGAMMDRLRTGFTNTSSDEVRPQEPRGSATSDTLVESAMAQPQGTTDSRVQQEAPSQQSDTPDAQQAAPSAAAGEPASRADPNPIPTRQRVPVRLASPPKQERRQVDRLQGPWKCPRCDAGCGSRSSLRGHLSGIHDVNRGLLGGWRHNATTDDAEASSEAEGDKDASDAGRPGASGTPTSADFAALRARHPTVKSNTAPAPASQRPEQTARAEPVEAPKYKCNLKEYAFIDFRYGTELIPAEIQTLCDNIKKLETTLGRDFPNRRSLWQHDRTMFYKRDGSLRHSGPLQQWSIQAALDYIASQDAAQAAHALATTAVPSHLESAVPDAAPADQQTAQHLLDAPYDGSRSQQDWIIDPHAGYNAAPVGRGGPSPGLHVQPTSAGDVQPLSAESIIKAFATAMQRQRYRPTPQADSAESPSRDEVAFHGSDKVESGEEVVGAVPGAVAQESQSPADAMQDDDSSSDEEHASEAVIQSQTTMKPRRQRKRHTRDDHPPTHNVPCDSEQCDRMFETKFAMRNHYTEQRSDVRCKCWFCPSDFARIDALYRHVRTIHDFGARPFRSQAEGDRSVVTVDQQGTFPRRAFYGLDGRRSDPLLWHGRLIQLVGPGKAAIFGALKGNRYDAQHEYAALPASIPQYARLSASPLPAQSPQTTDQVQQPQEDSTPVNPMATARLGGDSQPAQAVGLLTPEMQALAAQIQERARGLALGRTATPDDSTIAPERVEVFRRMFNSVHTMKLVIPYFRDAILILAVVNSQRKKKEDAFNYGELLKALKELHRLRVVELNEDDCVRLPIPRKSTESNETDSQDSPTTSKKRKRSESDDGDRHEDTSDTEKAEGSGASEVNGEPHGRSASPAAGQDQDAGARAIPEVDPLIYDHRAGIFRQVVVDLLNNSTFFDSGPIPADAVLVRVNQLRPENAPLFTRNEAQQALFRMYDADEIEYVENKVSRVQNAD